MKKDIEKKVVKKAKPAVKKIVKEPVKVKEDKIQVKAEGMEPTTTIGWEAPEFVHYKKDSYWKFGIMVLFGAMALMFVFVGTLPIGALLALCCVLLVVVLFQHADELPSKFYTELSERGILFRESRYDYSEFKAFWVTNEEEPRLYLEPAKFKYPISVLIEEKKPEEIRSYLLRYLPEHQIGGEHLTDKVLRFLRF